MRIRKSTYSINPLKIDKPIAENGLSKIYQILKILNPQQIDKVVPAIRLRYLTIFRAFNPKKFVCSIYSLSVRAAISSF